MIKKLVRCISEKRTTWHVQKRTLGTAHTKPDHGFAVFIQLYLYLKKTRRMTHFSRNCSLNKTVYKTRQETAGSPEWKIPEEADVPTRSLSRPPSQSQGSH